MYCLYYGILLIHIACLLPLGVGWETPANLFDIEEADDVSIGDVTDSCSSEASTSGR